jgi:putative copper resistance protein D
MIGARFIHYVALIFLSGSVAYANFGSGDAALRRRFRRWTFASGLLVFMGAAAVLAATVANLGGGYPALSDGSLWSAVIVETDFGKVWTGRLILAVASVAVSLAGLRGWLPESPVRAINVVLCIALVGTVAWTGHATMEVGGVGLLHRFADALHLLAAVAWLGALLPLLWLLNREDSAASSLCLSRFHNIGLVAVLFLVGSGIVNSINLVTGITALITTPYGQLLSLKLVLFAGMVGFACYNRFASAPALARAVETAADPAEAVGKLRLAIKAELALGIVVIAIVSVLGSIEPATSG